MLEAKLFEVRDKGTFLPVLAVGCWAPQGPEDRREEECYLLARSGYGTTPWGQYENGLVMLVDLTGGRRAEYDPYAWADRTFHVAHTHIMANWRTLRSGDVVDVETCLGETTKPKQSERITAPL